ncbi:efflux RND transporter periplasmic adaptor subunit [Parasedimentitalea maritima]|uniref:Efflux RND transporter periplasmic adaptor subunit n=1 Tax=Parasedimentitalea maritima TaxID=2578117 RepID=A0A6A4RM16_9RHOB|nr:efflux RND transporter periplasmic adaptor subunit [Zongyanglinia marina]KAE9631788.1 efflux RND transporter periplasmic adaptor subunit [Zongyanglinia marina]
MTRIKQTQPAPRSMTRRILAVSTAIALCTAPMAIAQETPPAPKVSVMAAVTKPIRNSESFIGRGEAKDKVDVIARVSGYLEEVLVEDGAEVQAGDLLFRIERSAYEATLEARRADLDKAEANLQLASVDLARKQELFTRGAVPEAERDTALANEKVSEAQVRAAKAAIQQAELDLSYTEVFAPFAGRVGRVAVSVGDVVGPTSKPLVNVVREAPIYVSFALNEKQFVSILQKIEGAEVTEEQERELFEVFVILPNGTELEKRGKFAFADNRIDPNTGAITLRAEFENTSRLIVDGSFLTVGLEAQKAEDRIVISQAAMQRDQQGPFVLVVDDQQMVEQRYIETGDVVGTGIIVLDGLEAGETVVVEGLQRIRPGAKVDPVLANQAGE